MCRCRGDHFVPETVQIAAAGKPTPVHPASCSDPASGAITFGAMNAPLGGYCGAAAGHPWHGPYHDEEYGFPITDESALFERLILEINQAGLSWLTILKKREGFQEAYDGFDVDRIAGYGEADRERLLGDARIIRNRLKVAAAIHNAGVLVTLRRSHGGFATWIEAHHPRTKPGWVKLFKETFRFTGGEITGEFLMSIGYLPGAHVDGCPVGAKIARLDPPWTTVGK